MSKETKDRFHDAVHVTAGIILGLAGWKAPVPSVAGLTAFGIFEYWQAKKIGDAGYHDFWGGMTGYILGVGIGLVLKLVGVM